MRVAVPKETAPGERRVALVPETVSKLREAGFEASVERGAGASAGFSDDDYASAGAELTDNASLTTGAEALACVASPSADVVASLAPGTVVIGFLENAGLSPSRWSRSPESHVRSPWMRCRPRPRSPDTRL